LNFLSAFHCQQAIEKSFKAVIEEFELGFIKSHDLSNLSIIIKNHLDLNKQADKLAEINDYYIESRYPGDLSWQKDNPLTINRLNEIVLFTKDIIASVSNVLSKQP
jgi:HEPN domain-containing protein